MSKKILIDALHTEETRVVVLGEDKLIQEFNFETTTKSQLKGNLYLAKVARIEPSLQAAFVDYGHDRHGFIAFSEIHPDYYRIPVDDRPESGDIPNGEGDFTSIIEGESEEIQTNNASSSTQAEKEHGALDITTADHDDETSSPEEENLGAEDLSDTENAYQSDNIDEEDEEEIAKSPSHTLKKKYKIQEVIHKNQILLVQVVREERGNKGAALTTHISLAGRYCVLMTNNTGGGGISRRIADQNIRKKLKKLLAELEVPEGMSVIIRTAGHERTKAEIKRDLEYILRLWDDIRKKTMESTAPSLIHEEANLLKRSIRDLYNKEVEEIVVAGEEGYKSARALMKQLIPSHAKKVSLYKSENNISLFTHYDVERQLADLHSPTVYLKSGGSIVIHQTEALVAIDVNSGRSTKERHIDDTALKTNLEAAEEIARQLHLRDLAGLIVIDFIDMNENSHINKVEQKLKECLKSDHARIQVGSISSFGLLEMSRQRLNPSILEATGRICPTCRGVGYVKSTASTILEILREVENICPHLVRQEHIKPTITVEVSSDVAIYALNHKRGQLSHIEESYHVLIVLHIDDKILPTDYRIIAETTEDAPTRIIAQLPEKERFEQKIKNKNNQKKKTSSDKDSDRKQNNKNDVSENQDTKTGNTTKERNKRRRVRKKAQKKEHNTTSPSEGVVPQTLHNDEHTQALSQHQDAQENIKADAAKPLTEEDGGQKKPNRRRKRNTKPFKRHDGEKNNTSSIGDHQENQHEKPQHHVTPSHPPKNASKDSEAQTTERKAPESEQKTKTTDTPTTNATQGEGKKTGWWNRLIN